MTCLILLLTVKLYSLQMTPNVSGTLRHLLANNCYNVTLITPLAGVHPLIYILPHLKAAMHLSFNWKFPTSYTISGNIIITKQSHKDLEVTLSDNLEWKTDHDVILSKAYKTLGLVRRTFSSSISPLNKVKLYVSLIRSQLMYCSPIWHP